MLPEIGATELLVIAAVALIVVGPKDLPVLLRKLGQFMGKLRSMAADFRASFDEMARQSELDELRAEVEAMRKGQLADMAALQAGDAQVSKVFQEIDQGLASSGASFPPVTVHEAAATEPRMSEHDAMAPAAEPPPKPKAARKTTAKAAPAGKKPAAPKPTPKTPTVTGKSSRSKSGTVS